MAEPTVGEVVEALDLIRSSSFAPYMVASEFRSFDPAGEFRAAWRASADPTIVSCTLWPGALQPFEKQAFVLHFVREAQVHLQDPWLGEAIRVAEKRAKRRMSCEEYREFSSLAIDRMAAADESGSRYDFLDPERVASLLAWLVLPRDQRVDMRYSVYLFSQVFDRELIQAEMAAYVLNHTVPHFVDAVSHMRSRARYGQDSDPYYESTRFST